MIGELIKQWQRSHKTTEVHVHVVPTASGALEACRSARFDLVLLDYLLPAEFHGDLLLPPLRAAIGHSLRTASKTTVVQT